MNVSRILLPSALTFIACETDKTINEFNYNPEIQITSHQDGVSLYEGDTVVFAAAVSDQNDELDDLKVSWKISGREVCSGATPDVSGNSSCEITIEEGENSIVAEVRDPNNDVGQDTITLDLIENNAPDALIYSPLGNGVFYSDQLITFEGKASDTEDDVEDLVIFWESSIDGELTIDTTPDGNGTFVDFGYLSEGEHGLSLHVEDSNGKSDVETVTIVVGPPNSVPDCSIIAPSNSDIYPFGQSIIFEAQATDPDVPSDWLSVEWNSDKDGSIGSSTPTSAGEVLFAFSDLSANTHVVSMTVTDELGETCTDNVLVVIGSPPSVQIDAPTDGSILSEGSVVTFTGTVSDPEDTAPILNIEWTSSLDGVLDTTAASGSGATSFSLSNLSAGTHTVQLSATDSDSLSASDSIAITINTPPSVPTVSISPTPAYTIDDLVGSATGSIDPEGDTVSYSYEWMESGTTQHTGITLPASMTTKNQMWTLRVTPSDAYGSGNASEATISISNTAPVMSSLSIAPSSAISTNTTLICTATNSDVDVLDTPTTTYTWTSGVQSLGSGATLDLSTTTLSPGDTVTCSATTTDGTDSVSDSVDVQIDNTPPQITSTDISPDPAYNNNTITCTLVASDADGDPITEGFVWSNGSTTIGTGASITLDSTLGVPGDTITCDATVTDINGGTASSTSSVLLSNRVPAFSSLLITPNTGVQVGSVLTCAESSIDDDDDTISAQYAWSSNGLPIGTGSTLTVTTGMVAVGNPILCTATISDPHGGTAIDNTSVTLENSAPVLSVSISPNTGIQNTTSLTCNATATDPDGGIPTLSYEWQNGTTTVATSSVLTLTPSTSTKGDTLTCTVSADDGFTTTTVSDSVTVENTPPEVLSGSIDPNILYTDNVASVLSSTTDADGDSVTTTIDWYVDTGSGPSLVYSGSTLDGTYFNKNNTIFAEITPNDGSADGAVFSTASITITNTAPQAPTIEIQPSSATEGLDNLTCAVTIASLDEDGDTSTYTVEWYNNGNMFTSTNTTNITGDTVPASSTAKDEVWECIVTPNDGTDDGPSTAASITILENCDFDGDGFDSNSCGGPDCDDNDPTIGDCFTGSGSWTSTETLLESLVYSTATFDETNNRIFVYGGQTYYSLSESLYEYDQNSLTWSTLSYSGVSPEPIMKHSSAFDPTLEKWLIFGGQTYYSLSDTLYILDTTSGAELWYMASTTSTAPDARMGSAMVMDTNSSVAYLIGGQGYYTLYDDMWSIDLNSDLSLTSSSATVSWVEETPAGTIPPLYGASAGFDQNNEELWLIGGQTYYALNDAAYCLDLSTMTWAQATLNGDTLPPMVWSSLTWSDHMQGFMVVGGESYYTLVGTSYAIIPSSTCTAEVIEISTSGNTPPPLLGASLVYDPSASTHTLIGGQGYYTLYDHLISFQ